jgi:hypothetical protein
MEGRDESNGDRKTAVTSGMATAAKVPWREEREHTRKAG